MLPVTGTNGAASSSSNSATSSTTARLHTIRPPPDLSAKKKPQFAPIIPQGRRKEKAPEVKKVAVPPAVSGGVSGSSGVGGVSGGGGAGGGRRVLLQAAPLPPSGLFALGPPGAAHAGAITPDARNQASAIPEKKEEPPRFDSCDPTHPISLPLVSPDVKKELNTIKLEDVAAELPHVPVNIPFHDENGNMLNDDKLFLMQFPTILPCDSKSMSRVFSENTPPPTPSSDQGPSNSVVMETLAAPNVSNDDEQRETSIPPQGEMGTLRFHKSGKVTLKLGEIIFTLHSSSSSFLEEAWSVSIPEKQCTRLGEIAQHVVMQPDIEQCLSLVK
eukprot:TRINITY_DN23677_c0_g1_i1.p1 TRINITY_DN23677_c0_g1~~TRINITY_DN23677_c0_g1_i1.p1  ORF type:complete len:330 (-),score=103.79 TRINITY_DN23677_c0_g1_i1:37-1026(-)